MQIYNHDLMLSIGETDSKLFKTLKEVGIDEDEVNNAAYAHTGEARFCLFKNGQSLIRIKKKPITAEDFGFLQHEIFHVVSGLLWRIGMKLKIETSCEAYAYLTGYLTTEIYKHIL